MSCFNIMACAGGADEQPDHLASDENTASSDKRRWSFRKRSARHRVLSNTVISEPVTISCSQENQQITVDNFQSTKYSSCTEKTSIQEKTDERSLRQSTTKDEEVYPLVISSKPSIHESEAVVIQAHIRGYLARKEYKRTKSAIKLQAAVRGHLVRRKAVGTLRCVQAIIKMQALVRARYAHQPAEGFSGLEAKEDSGKESHEISSPSEKLLSNGFARQLLESNTSTKSINIKCQPSKSDAAWKWMERWMAVTSSSFSQQNEKEHCIKRDVELEECTKLVNFDTENEFISESNCIAKSEQLTEEDAESNSMAENNIGPYDHEPEANMRSSLNLSPDYDAKNFPLQNEVVEAIKNEQPETADEKDIEPHLDYYQLKSDLCLKRPSDSFSEKPYSTSEDSTKEESNETVANEGKPLVVGRKSSNPAFAAVKSKFEELSSSSTVSKPNACQDAVSKQKFNSQKSPVHSLTSKETSATGSSAFYDPGVQVATSECGTEISISSTLDSPDRSETDGGEIVLEIEALQKENHATNSASDKAVNVININIDGTIPTTESDPSMQQEHEKGDSNSENFVSGEKVDTLENLSESVTSIMPMKRVSAADEKVKSPEGTPRSQAAAPELHGTPSSQVSLDTNTSRRDTGVPIQKHKNQITAKNSSSSPSKGSRERANIEQLSKEAKHAKRRHSFGISKPDQVDKELKTTNTSSLPSYMQATLSARAKAHGTVSPKLSPDVQENQTRKRHSLPTENGKQNSSPRMQRSASQAQQKANGTDSPQNLSERKWQR